MVRLQWKERYAIGYREIDAQHQRLLSILNGLNDQLQSAQADEEAVRTHFRELCSYAMAHFGTEERYMEGVGYPHLARHASEHATFVNRILELDRTYLPSDPALLRELTGFLTNWLLNHILKSDMDYASHLKGYRAVAPIKAVVFDYGNVIARFDNHRFLEALSARTGRSEEELQRRIYGSLPLLRGFESGAMDATAVHRRACVLCGMDLDEGELRAMYADIFTPIPETHDLIRRLKATGRYKLGLVSDTSPWHYEDEIRKSPAFRLFDAVSVSFEAGALKPDPRIFDHCLEQLGVLAENCVFVDDRPENVAGAEEQLWRGVTYTDPAAVEKALRRMGLDF